MAHTRMSNVWSETATPPHRRMSYDTHTRMSHVTHTNESCVTWHEQVAATPSNVWSSDVAPIHGWCHIYEWNHSWVSHHSSCHIYEWTPMNDSIHICDKSIHICDMTHACVWTSDVTPMNDSCNTHQWVIPRTQIGHVWSETSKSRQRLHIYDWVMPNTRMSHVTHSNRSRVTWNEQVAATPSFLASFVPVSTPCGFKSTPCWKCVCVCVYACVYVCVCVCVLSVRVCVCVRRASCPFSHGEASDPQFFIRAIHLIKRAL